MFCDTYKYIIYQPDILDRFHLYYSNVFIRFSLSLLKTALYICTIVHNNSRNQSWLLNKRHENRRILRIKHSNNYYVPH